MNDVERIEKAVCTELEVSRADLYSKRRFGALPDARCILIAHLRRAVKMEAKDIAAAVGADRSTVSYNLQRFDRLHASDQRFKDRVKRVIGAEVEMLLGLEEAAQ